MVFGVSLDRLRSVVPTGRILRRDPVLRDKIIQFIKAETYNADGYTDLARKVNQKFDIIVTSQWVRSIFPTIWGDKWREMRRIMSENKKKHTEWRNFFELNRINIHPAFRNEYISSSDGVYIDPKTYEIKPIPSTYKMKIDEKREIVVSKKKIPYRILYTREGYFGYDPKNDEVDLRLRKIVERNVRTAVDKLIKRRKEDLLKEEVAKIKFDLIKKGEIEKYTERKIRKMARKKLKDKFEQIESIRDYLIDSVMNALPDERMAYLFGEDVLDKILDPAYASNNKKFRGRQRMLAEPGEKFSRATLNIPKEILLYMPPKRLQISSHNIAKNFDLYRLVDEKLKRILEEKYGDKLPFLKEIRYSKGREEPALKAKYNDIEGVNLRIRFPKNLYEYVRTMESGVILTKKAASRLSYVQITTPKTMIVESLDDIVGNPPVLPHEIKSQEDIIKFLEQGYDLFKVPVKRGQLLVERAPEGVNKNQSMYISSYDGYLVLVSPGTKKDGSPHKVTLYEVDPETGKRKVIRFYLPKYQIIRVSSLKPGGKVFSRSGIKAVVVDVVDDLGKDEKGRPYDMVINPDDVWMEDPDPEKDKVLTERAKKRGGIVKERQLTDGLVYISLAGKFPEDIPFKPSSGLSLSMTFLGGLFEKIKSDKKIAEWFFKDNKRLAAIMKTFHLRMVENKKTGEIWIERDPEEPKPDENGRVIYMPHYWGLKYDWMYIPYFLDKRYVDQNTIRENFIEYLPKDPALRKEALRAAFHRISTALRGHGGILPRYKSALHLVAVTYADPKKLDRVDTILMDIDDVRKLGLDPKEKELWVTLRKEPVTEASSIQTFRVKVDTLGKFKNCVGVHPLAAKRMTLDFDGDTVVAFTPAIEEFKIQPLSSEEKAKLKNIPKLNWKDLESKLEKIKYQSEDELAKAVAKYNQEQWRADKYIGKFGGIRKRAIFAFAEPIKLKLDGKEYTLTLSDINRITNVEKIMKMRDPFGKLEELQKQYKAGKKLDEFSEKDRKLLTEHLLRAKLDDYLRKHEPVTKKIFEDVKTLTSLSLFGVERYGEPKVKLDRRRRIDNLFYLLLKNSPVHVVVE